jgi:hypothetical protein
VNVREVWRKGEFIRLGQVESPYTRTGYVLREVQR